MSGNTAGTIAKVGIPLALAAVTGGAGAALAPALEGGALGLDAAQAGVAAGALTGAASGAAGSALTGGNPLTGAALGGIGGGLMQTGAVKGLLDSGNAASSVASNAPNGTGGLDMSAIQPGTGTFNASDLGNVGGKNFDLASATPSSAFSTNPANITSVAPTASSGIGGMLARNALPIAGGVAVLATSGSGKQGVAPQGNNLQPNDVEPLQRTQIATDPNAYYGVGGARQNFDVVNPAIHVTPQTKYASGGSVQHFANGGSALYQKAKGPSSFKQGAFHLAVGGMPQGIGSMVNGAGDGQSDQIPAMLSDGEYVIPAPVVSAIGRGSNNAGAKKLDKMKHHVMKKTYKGGKPPMAGMGIGAMRAS